MSAAATRCRRHPTGSVANRGPPDKETGSTPTTAGIVSSGLRIGYGGSSGQFKQGNPGGPGRPKGSRNGNRSRVDLAQMIMNVAERAGFKVLDENGKFIPGDQGCEGYLLWVALNDHRTYCSLLARILPYYVIPDVQEKTILTHEETMAQLRDRGLPEELIDYLRKAPDELQVGEDPDPYHMRDITPVKPDV
jgi:hypothetical protein